jgi:hypothetical protein
VSKTVHFYLMECLGGDTTKHDGEVASVAWFHVRDAVGVVAYRGERDVLRHALATLDGGH